MKPARGGEVRAVMTNGVTLDVAFAGPDVATSTTASPDAADADTPILILHGFPESREQWRPVVTALVAAGHRVTAPNLRGYSAGARPEGAENYGVSHHVDDIVGLLDARGLERVHLVGLDWGTIPTRFASLTAVSTATPHAVADALAVDGEQRDAMQYIKHLRAPGAEDNLRADDWFKLRRLAADLLPEQLAHHLDQLAEPGALTGALNYYRAFDPPRRRRPRPLHHSYHLRLGRRRPGVSHTLRRTHRRARHCSLPFRPPRRRRPLDQRTRHRRSDDRHPRPGGRRTPAMMRFPHRRAPA